MSKAMRQMLAKTGRAGEARGEAQREPASDEASGPPREVTDRLIQQALLELLALGASHEVARQIAANSRRWWRNSGKLLNSVLTLAWFDRLGLPRLA